MLLHNERTYQPQTPRAYQRAAIDAIKAAWNQGERAPLVALATGGGKALTVDTLVLTPSGYKRMGDVAVGDSVIGSDGRPTTVIGVYPQGERDAFEITFSDGVRVQCDGDHLWSVRTRYDRYHSKQRTKFDSGAYRVLTTRQLIKNNAPAGEGNRWFIPLVAPITFDELPLPLDPYLLGLLIGDGYMGGDGAVPTISTADDEILASVRALLPDGVILKHRGAYDWSLTKGVKGNYENPITRELRNFGLWGKRSESKFIPQAYLYNSVENRLKMLQGLLDTDGYVDTRGHCSFCTTSEELAQNVAFLVQSFGGLAPIHTKKTKGQLAYNLYFSLPNDVMPFRLTRKQDRWKPRTKYLPTRSISSIEPCGTAQMVCIAVDAADSLYVIEHGIVTHNTTVASQLLLETVDPTTERALVVAHTEEIIGQFADRIANQFDGALDTHFGEFYAPGLGIVQGERNALNARLVVGTRQSLHPQRLKALLRHGKIKTLLIDEAHHALADNTYGEIVDTVRAHNPDLRIAGLTATPSRGDERALGSIFSKIVYEWLIPHGIAEGYLVPVTRIKVATDVSLIGVKTTAGDYVQNKLVSVLETANWLDLCVQAYMEYVAATDRQCLAFLPSVDMSQAFAERLRKRGIQSAHLDGDTDKDKVRRPMLRQYAEGKLRVISNMGVLIEGFDAPATGAIFFARPTQSRTLFTQAVGRGLRPFPGKHDCLLVDLTVNDTRALEVGSLLGRMVICPKCKAEHYAAMKTCPNCGYTRTWKERAKQGESVIADDPMTGGRLVANYDSLFEKAFAAWYMAPDGFLSCNLTYEDGAFIIVPPLEDNYYRLAYVPKDRNTKVEYVVRNEDLASLMLDADVQVRQRAGSVASKDASWRTDPASPAQLQLLKKLGAASLANPTKGMASQLITHTLAVRRLIEAGN